MFPVADVNHLGKRNTQARCGGFKHAAVRLGMTHFIAKGEVREVAENSVVLHDLPQLQSRGHDGVAGDAQTIILTEGFQAASQPSMSRGGMRTSM